VGDPAAARMDRGSRGGELERAAGRRVRAGRTRRQGGELPGDALRSASMITRNARYKKTPKGKASYKRYAHSPKGKATKARYARSAKAKAQQAQYRLSPAGKATRAKARARYRAKQAAQRTSGVRQTN
jgi:hypothetical protein